MRVWLPTLCALCSVGWAAAEVRGGCWLLPACRFEGLHVLFAKTVDSRERHPFGRNRGYLDCREGSPQMHGPAHDALFRSTGPYAIERLKQQSSRIAPCALAPVFSRYRKAHSFPSFDRSVPHGQAVIDRESFIHGQDERPGEHFSDREAFSLKSAGGGMRKRVPLLSCHAPMVAQQHGPRNTRSGCGAAKESA